MITEAELLATMLAASQPPAFDLDIDEPDLDMLAYDIADAMDRGDYGMGDITSDDIRAVLPAFLIACLANADANAVPLCGHCDAPCVLAAHADGHDNPADCRCGAHIEAKHAGD